MLLGHYATNKQQLFAALLLYCSFAVMMVEHSTSTTTDSDNHKQAVADLKFSPHSLSYAQRLMLKQHRRTDIGHLGTPRLGSADTSVTGSSGLTSVTPRLSSVGRGEGHGSDDGELFVALVV